MTPQEWEEIRHKLELSGAIAPSPSVDSPVFDTQTTETLPPARHTFDPTYQAITGQVPRAEPAPPRDADPDEIYLQLAKEIAKSHLLNGKSGKPDKSVARVRRAELVDPDPDRQYLEAAPPRAELVDPDPDARYLAQAAEMQKKNQPRPAAAARPAIAPARPAAVSSAATTNPFVNASWWGTGRPSYL